MFRRSEHPPKVGNMLVAMAQVQSGKKRSAAISAEEHQGGRFVFIPREGKNIFLFPFALLFHLRSTAAKTAKNVKLVQLCSQVELRLTKR